MLSISIKYMDRLHKSLHSSQSLLLAQAIPPLRGEAEDWSNYLPSLPGLCDAATGCIRKWLVSSAKYAQHRHKTHHDSFNFPTFFLRYLPVHLTSFVPFFPTSLCLPRGKYEWRNTSHPLPRLPRLTLSPPRPAGLDLAMKLQKRASCGYAR